MAQSMAWRPGPQPSPGLGSLEYDERDPWTQRFISKTEEDGELFVDVNVSTAVVLCFRVAHYTTADTFLSYIPAFQNIQAPTAVLPTNTAPY